MTINEPGGYSIYQEFPGASDSGGPIGPPDVVVADPTGEAVDIDTYGSFVSYDQGSHEGRGIYTFRADQPGNSDRRGRRSRLHHRGGPGHGRRSAHAVAGIFGGVIGGMILAGSGIVTGIGLAITLGIARGRSRRRQVVHVPVPLTPPGIPVAAGPRPGSGPWTYGTTGWSPAPPFPPPALRAGPPAPLFLPRALPALPAGLPPPPLPPRVLPGAPGWTSAPAVPSAGTPGWTSGPSVPSAGAPGWRGPGWGSTVPGQPAGYGHAGPPAADHTGRPHDRDGSRGGTAGLLGRSLGGPRRSPRPGAPRPIRTRVMGRRCRRSTAGGGNRVCVAPPRRWWSRARPTASGAHQAAVPAPRTAVAALAVDWSRSDSRAAVGRRAHH